MRAHIVFSNVAYLVIGLLGAAGTLPRIASSDTILVASSETRIEQAHGTIKPQGKPTAPGEKPSASSLSKKTPELQGMPERGGTIGTGPTSPVTCTAENASSPACHTATQQARPAR
ncbi:MAG TPA: hypothetical protein VFX37_04480 [Pseudolabrys sp.]|nr:hypothetical protein [Pseudolabrys sp.]